MAKKATRHSKHIKIMELFWFFEIFKRCVWLVDNSFSYRLDDKYIPYNLLCRSFHLKSTLFAIFPKTTRHKNLKVGHFWFFWNNSEMGLVRGYFQLKTGRKYNSLFYSRSLNLKLPLSALFRKKTSGIVKT